MNKVMVKQLQKNSPDIDLKLTELSTGRITYRLNLLFSFSFTQPLPPYLLGNPADRRLIPSHEQYMTIQLQD